MTKELTQTQINMIAVYLAHGILVKSGGAAAPGFQVVLALAVQEHVISRFGPLTEMKQLSMLQEKCSIAAKVSSDIGHVLMNPWGIVSGPHKLSIVEFFTLVELVDEGYLSCGNFARSEWRDAAVKFFN